MKIVIGAMLAAAVTLAVPSFAMAGDSCFVFRTKTTEAFLTLSLPKGNGSVKGSENGTVQDDEQGYYTSWQSTITGKRKGNKLNAIVETKIEDDLQKERKTFEFTKDGAVVLNGDRYEPLDCASAHPAE